MKEGGDSFLFILAINMTMIMCIFISFSWLGMAKKIVRLGRCKFGSVLDGSHIFVRIMDFCFLIWLEELVKNMYSRYSSIAPRFVPYHSAQKCGVVLNRGKLKRKFHIPLLVMKTFIEECKNNVIRNGPIKVTN